MKKFVLYFFAGILAINFSGGFFYSAAAKNALQDGENFVKTETKNENIFAKKSLENEIFFEENEEILEFSEIAPRICLLNSDCKKSSWGQNSFVEIYNPTNQEFSQIGWKIQYAAATGENFLPKKWENIAEISEKIAPNSYLILAAWPGNGASGFLRIIDENGKMIDQVGYGSANFSENLAPETKQNFSVQRCEMSDKKLHGIWILSEKLTPGEKTDCEILSETEEENPENSQTKNACENLKLNEIGANLTEQFIELKNISSQEISLFGCQISTNRGAAKFVFAEEKILAPNEIYAIKISETDLKLTKTTSGEVFVLSARGDEIDSQKYENLKTNSSFAKFSDGWQQTFAVTRGAENVFQKFPSCEAGYFYNQETGRCKKIIVEPEFLPCQDGYERNPETNRCRKIAKENILAACPVGYFRNPETNRCKKIATNSSDLKACPAGYFRNPETNRCKKNSEETETKLKPCAPGYERNPETNRCRKIANNSEENAKFAIEEIPATEAEKNFWWILIIFTILAFLAILIFQYRFEIRQFFAKKSDKKISRKSETKKTRRKK